MNCGIPSYLISIDVLFCYSIIQLDEEISELKGKLSGHDLADASISRGAVVGPGDPALTG